jgi:hypothetical protein
MDGGTLARITLDPHFPAQHFRALTHPGQAQPTAPKRRARIKARAIIPHNRDNILHTGTNCAFLKV